MNPRKATSIRWAVWTIAVAIQAVAALQGANATTHKSRDLQGVVVEDLGDGADLGPNGINPGDILLSWRRAPLQSGDLEATEGEILSIFDWLRLSVELSPRGPVELLGKRAKDTKRFQVNAENWKVKALPRMPEELSRAYSRGRGLLANGDPKNAALTWEATARTALRKGYKTISCWFHFKLGELWLQEHEPQKASKSYHSALIEAQDVTAKSLIWEAIGNLHMAQKDFSNASKAYSASLSIERNQQHLSLRRSKLELALGRLARQQGNQNLAAHYLSHSYELQRELLKDSLAITVLLDELGGLSADQGNLQAAKDYHEKSLKIRQNRAPNSLDLAISWNNLGVIASLSGSLLEAEAYHKQALKLREQLAPRSLQLASSLSNLGILASMRGDVELSSQYFTRALEIYRNLAPGSPDMARGLLSQGIIAGSRADWRLASDYLEQALAIMEHVAPKHPAVELILGNLGVVAYESGDFGTASKYLERILALQRRRAPASIETALTLANLAELDRNNGNLQRAKDRLKQALAIQQVKAPSSLDKSGSMRILGLVYFELGKQELALQYLRQALAIEERLAPNSASEAEAAYSIAIALKSTQPMLAQQYFLRAISSLESQIGKLGESQEIKARVRGHSIHYYQDAIELMVDQGETIQAFNILERSRARALIALLAERDMLFTKDLPDELRDALSRLAARYDSVQQQLAHTNPEKEKNKSNSLAVELERLRHEHEDTLSRVRSSSPRFADLQYPEPLQFSTSQQALDPGTVLLSYSVGRNRSFIFILTSSGPLEVKALSIPEKELRRDVELLRKLILESRLGAGLNSTQWKTFMSTSNRLYTMLIEPCAPTIEQAKRILILPDGPLHTLPWSALIRKRKDHEGPGNTWQYLAEWKPIHTALSSTLFAELRKARPLPQTSLEATLPSLAAFGDPLYPLGLTAGNKENLTDARILSAAERGFTFESLPGTRNEVQLISNLYSPRAMVFLGSEASEENAKSLPRNTRIVHFATHATLDERLPLNSAVVLSIPERFEEGKENGLLQAWEIFEQVRLDADLVVLSACESGLGTEMGGEGLIGLTRAFQYAGARSVMASLWKISDRTTAELMVRFYKHLKDGLPKDEALRAAQMELIRGPIQVKNEKGEVETIDASAPYYWAAFQIYGDWQ
ncbi:MAG: CHAT domain-containing protein [Thermoanaerobaculia bacterium]